MIMRKMYKMWRTLFKKKDQRSEPSTAYSTTRLNYLEQFSMTPLTQTECPTYVRTYGIRKRLRELFLRALSLERASSRRYQCDDGHDAIEACVSTKLR
jgi:hypothetical protein